MSLFPRKGQKACRIPKAACCARGIADIMHVSKETQRVEVELSLIFQELRTQDGISCEATGDGLAFLRQESLLSPCWSRSANHGVPKAAR